LKTQQMIIFALSSPRRLRYCCPLLDPGDGERGRRVVEPSSEFNQEYRDLNE